MGLTTYRLTSDNFDAARLELIGRREILIVEHRRELDALAAKIAAITAAQAVVEELSGEIVDIQADEVVAEQAAPPKKLKAAPLQSVTVPVVWTASGENKLTPSRHLNRPARRKLNLPSGSTSGGVPTRWTEELEDRILSVDPKDKSAMQELSVVLNKSVSAIRKQQGVARKKRDAWSPEQIAQHQARIEEISEATRLAAIETITQPITPPFEELPPPSSKTEEKIEPGPPLVEETDRRRREVEEMAAFIAKNGVTQCPATGSDEARALPLPYWDPRTKKMIGSAGG